MKHYFILILLSWFTFLNAQTTYDTNSIGIGLRFDTINNSTTKDTNIVYIKLKKGTNYKYFVKGIDFTKYSLVLNHRDTIIMDKNTNQFTFPSLTGFDIKDLSGLIKDFSLKILGTSTQDESTKQETYSMDGPPEPKTKAEKKNGKKSINQGKDPCKPTKCDNEFETKINNLLMDYSKVRNSTLQDLTDLNLSMISWVEQITKAKYSVYASEGMKLKIEIIFKEFIQKVNQSKQGLLNLSDSVNSNKCTTCIVSECVKSKDTLLRSNINALTKQLDELGKFMNLDSLAKFMNMEQLARNSRSENFYSLPHYFNGEAKEINIDLVPREPFYGPKYSTMIKIEEKGKPYFGYSSGIFMSLLKNHNYTLVTDTFIKKSYLIFH